MRPVCPAADSRLPKVMLFDVFLSGAVKLSIDSGKHN